MTILLPDPPRYNCILDTPDSNHLWHLLVHILSFLALSFSSRVDVQFFVSTKWCDQTFKGNVECLSRDPASTFRPRTRRASAGKPIGFHAAPFSQDQKPTTAYLWRRRLNNYKYEKGHSQDPNGNFVSTEGKTPVRARLEFGVPVLAARCHRL